MSVNESQANCLVYNCLIKALEVLEDSPPDALFNTMLMRFGLSEKELFTNYKLFKKALRDLLEDNADIIIDTMKKEIRTMSHDKKNEPLIKGVLRNISNEVAFARL